MLDSDDELIDEQTYWNKHSRQLRAGFQTLEAEKRGDIRPRKRRKTSNATFQSVSPCSGEGEVLPHRPTSPPLSSSPVLQHHDDLLQMLVSPCEPNDRNFNSNIDLDVLSTSHASPLSGWSSQLPQSPDPLTSFQRASFQNPLPSTKRSPSPPDPLLLRSSSPFVGPASIESRTAAYSPSSSPVRGRPSLPNTTPSDSFDPTTSIATVYNAVSPSAIHPASVVSCVDHASRDALSSSTQVNGESEEDPSKKARYPLRQRRQEQIAPFTVEKHHYLRAMANNKAAIVKFKNYSQLGRSGEEEDGEYRTGESQDQTQTQSFNDEFSQTFEDVPLTAASGLAAAGARHTEELRYEFDNSGAHEDLLGSDSSTEDVRKDAEKHARKKKREEAKRAKLLKSAKKQKFPAISRNFPRVGDNSSGEGASAPTRHSRRSDSPSLDARMSPPAVQPASSRRSRSQRRIQRSVSRIVPSSPASSEDESRARDFQNGPPINSTAKQSILLGDTIDLSDDERRIQPASPGFRNQSPPVSTPVTQSSTVATTPTPSGSSDEDDNSQFKLLVKVVPRFMAKKMLQADKTQNAARRIHRTSSHAISGPLHAGQSKRRQGHAFTGTIAGDEESDEEPRLTPPSPKNLHDYDFTVQDVPRSPSHFVRTSSATLVAEISDDDVEVLSSSPAPQSEHVEQGELDDWQRDFSTLASHRTTGTDSLREQDLFDRMLVASRRISGLKIPRRKSNKPKTTGDPHNRRSQGGASHTSISAQHNTPAHPRKTDTHTLQTHPGASHERTARKYQMTLTESFEQVHIEDHLVRDKDKRSNQTRKKRKRQPNYGQTYQFISTGTAMDRSRRLFAEQIQIPDMDFVRAVSQAPDISRQALTLRSTNTLSATPSTGNPGNRDSDLWSERHGSQHNNNPVDPYAYVKASPIRHFKADCDIDPLPAGVKFGIDTYLGSFKLKALLSLLDTSPLHIPAPSYFEEDIDFNAPSWATFAHSLGLLHQFIIRWLQEADGCMEIAVHTVDARMTAACHAFTWLLASMKEDDVMRLGVHKVLDDFVTSISQSLSVDTQVIKTNIVRWYLAELAVRAENSPLKWDIPQTDNLLYELIQSLYMNGTKWYYDFIQQDDPNVPCGNAELRHRCMEIWICTLHLASARSSLAGHPHWFISSLTRLMEQDHRDLPAPEACERQWKTIFMLCALSSFNKGGVSLSEHRPLDIPNIWTLPLLALRPINLTASDTEVDMRERTRALVARDAFIKLLLTRFSVLIHTWKWVMNDPLLIFGRLHEIFRSRRFADLHDEHHDPEFPPFMVKDRSEIWKQPNAKDTGYWIYLKIFLATADYLRQHGEHLKLKKMFSVTRPIRKVIITPNNMTDQDYRTVFNRIGWAATVFLADPLSDSATSSWNQVQDHIQFSGSPAEVRQTCIRGMMYYALLLAEHRQSDVSPALDWACRMTNTLIDEFQSTGGLSKAEVALQLKLLLRSLRSILKKLYIEPAEPAYPPPVFLTGPWSQRLLECRMHISQAVHIGEEIRGFVTEFLQAREPRHGSDIVAATEDSQDLYGGLDLDETTFAAIDAVADDAAGTSSGRDYGAEDDIIVEVLARVITYAMHTFICQQQRVSLLNNGEAEELNRWIDTWALCANVVRKRRQDRDWDYYIQYGKESYERHGSAIWRRYVGLRFMWNVIKVHPGAYHQLPREFFRRFFESLVASNISVHAEYIYMILQADDYTHQLFNGLRAVFNVNLEAELSVQDFLRLRIPLIQGILSNVAKDPTSESLIPVETMLYAIHDARELVSSLPFEFTTYNAFTSQVLAALQFHGLAQIPRLKPIIAHAFPA